MVGTTGERPAAVHPVTARLGNCMSLRLDCDGQENVRAVSVYLTGSFTRNERGQKSAAGPGPEDPAGRAIDTSRCFYGLHIDRQIRFETAVYLWRPETQQSGIA